MLNKPRSREELAEEFRAQQEKLQCALNQCETVRETEEEKPSDQVVHPYSLYYRRSLNQWKRYQCLLLKYINLFEGAVDAIFFGLV